MEVLTAEARGTEDNTQKRPRSFFLVISRVLQKLSGPLRAGRCLSIWIAGRRAHPRDIGVSPMNVESAEREESKKRRFLRSVEAVGSPLSSARPSSSFAHPRLLPAPQTQPHAPLSLCPSLCTLPMHGQTDRQTDRVSRWRAGGLLSVWLLRMISRARLHQPLSIQSLTFFW